MGLALGPLMYRCYAVDLSRFRPRVVHHRTNVRTQLVAQAIEGDMQQPAG